jgi:hypothetical protein
MSKRKHEDSEDSDDIEYTPSKDAPKRKKKKGKSRHPQKNTKTVRIRQLVNDDEELVDEIDVEDCTPFY